MAKFKSKITLIISRIKDQPFGVLVPMIESSLNEFLENKTAGAPNALSEDGRDFLKEIIMGVKYSTNLEELDITLHRFQKVMSRTFDLQLGELEFAVIKHLQLQSEEATELAKEIFPENSDSKETPKEKSKVLPFKPEGGRH